MAYDLQKILEHYGVYVSRDTWTKVKCPVHQDNIPSATVNLESGYVHCFACGFSGNALDLVMAREGLTREAALRVIEELDGVSDARVRGGSGWRTGRAVPGGTRYQPAYRSGAQARVRRH